MGIWGESEEESVGWVVVSTSRGTPEPDAPHPAPTDRRGAATLSS